MLGGLGSALNYEKLRADGWHLSEGWDTHAPKGPGLPQVREYQLRNAVNEKVNVTEPEMVSVRALEALAELARSGRWSVTIGAESLYMPGQALHITIRPRY